MRSVPGTHHARTFLYSAKHCGCKFVVGLTATTVFLNFGTTQTSAQADRLPFEREEFYGS
jgi:hypothetical protein